MWKKLKVAVLLAGLCFFSFSTSTRVTAEPSAPVEVVNHTTQECATLWPGDECQQCVPAAGWEVLTGDCPAGYTVLDQEPPKDCSLTASPYCCGSVNGDWIGCASYPGYAPPRSVRLWIGLAGLTIAGLGLFVWLKRKAGRQ
jgi:hypothetical protein